MSNITYTLTEYQTELQTRLNAVNGSTTNKQLIILGRALELNSGMTTTTYSAEVQTRLSATGAGTTDKELIELAVLIGKIDNAVFDKLPVSTSLLATSAEIAAIESALIIEHNTTQVDIAGVKAVVDGLTSSSSPIVSIQRGILDTIIAAGDFADVTIAAVDVAKSLVHDSGGGVFGSGIPPAMVQLLNSTTIRIYNGNNLQASYKISWQVIEYV